MECLLTGTTSVVDDVWCENGISLESTDAIMDAYDELGIRAWVTANLGDRPITEIDPFLEEYLTADQQDELTGSFVYDADRALSICEAALRRHNDPGTGNRVRFAMGASGPQQCTDGLLERIWEMARSWRVPVVSHVLETRAQAVASKLSYGMTIVEHLDRLGCLDDLTHIVHGIWLTSSDIELLASRGATVVHNPTSNLRLGSGICPLRELLDNGVNVALGSDGTCTNDSQNIFLEMRLAGCLHAAVGPDYAEWVQATDVFEMATMGGAKAVGLDGVLGEIEPGCMADLVLLDENSTAFAPLNDVVKNVVFAEHGQSVRTVLVDGTVVVDDGRVIAVDQDDVWEEAREHARRFFSDNEQGYQRMRDLLPAFEKAYRRAHEYPWYPSRYIRE
jgi:cytosine/adenosine deaminase-related metal-dependent hydrolase